MRILAILAAAAIVASLVAGLVCLPRLPDPMAVHWGFGDQPDGFMPKIAAIILIPLLSLLLLPVLAIFWALDAQIREPVHRRALTLAGAGTVVPVMLLLAYAQAIVLVWNLGTHIPVGRYILPGLAVLVAAMVPASIPLVRVSLADSREDGKRLPPALWFPAKRYGWGWNFPCKWQGWVAMVAWLVVLLGGELGLLLGVRGGRRVGLGILFPMVMVALMTGLCFWKGERPRWRWGDGA
jgi:hypothetical protein